jgi:hypothetical protein
VGVRQPAGAAAHSLPVLWESQIEEIEGCKRQGNADVPYQPFPESTPKEQQICTNDNGNPHHNQKHDRHFSCHFNDQFKYINSRLPIAALAGTAPNY